MKTKEYTIEVAAIVRKQYTVEADSLEQAKIFAELEATYDTELLELQGSDWLACNEIQKSNV